VDSVWQRTAKFQDRGWLHVLLFMLTLASTTLWGGLHYAGFLDAFRGSRELPMPFPALFLRGFWYSGTILLILGAHEMGHYLACRYYDVDATLPFFIPMPLFSTGTAGAVIRIREPMATKRIVFDIGIAGPIAGFLVAVPALFLGIGLSTLVPTPAQFPPGTDSLGEPLLFQLAEWVVWRTIPETQTLNMHPMALAAWFGLLVTMLNLMPVGQLDGGHISYAALGRASSYVSLVTLAVMLGLGFWYAPSWYVWCALITGMLYFFGRHHPPVLDESEPLDRARVILALCAVAILVLCFMPAPIQPLDLIGH
jgi:membrane-associated protease RseP (regulator of RpoE activity)